MRRRHGIPTATVGTAFAAVLLLGYWLSVLIAAPPTGKAPDHRFAELPASMAFLAALLAWARIRQVRARKEGHRLLLRRADQAGPPLLVVTAGLFLWLGGRPALLPFLLVGTVALAVQVAAVPWSRTTHPRYRRRRSRAAAPTAPPTWVRPAGSAGVPVSARTREWIDRSLDWFGTEFDSGGEPRPTVRPDSLLLPGRWDGGVEDVDELLGRVCRAMAVDRARLELVVRDFETPATRGRHTVATYARVGGRERVTVDLAQTGDQTRVAAILAHEVAHARLRGEGRTLPDFVSGTNAEEQLTDLLTVHLGLGILTANASMDFVTAAHGWTVEPLGELTAQMLNGAESHDYHTLGYLGEKAFGYALARHCVLRGGTAVPDWFPALDPGARGAFRRSLAFLADPGPTAAPRTARRA